MSARKPTLIILVCLIPLGWWLTSSPQVVVEKMVPGLDGRPEKNTLRDIQDSNPLVLKTIALASPQPSNSWPGFRGPDRNGLDPSDTPLADSWQGQPKQIWTQSLGEGHGAPVISDGMVFILDYEETTSRDLLRAFSLKTGQEFWQLGYRNPMKRNHGFSRSIPAIWEDIIVTLGPQGRVMAANKLTGTPLWDLDLVKNQGSEIPLWYTAQCPLIQEGVLILAPAGPQTLMIGLDVITGDVLWKTPNPLGIKMSHSSVIWGTIAGVPQFVYTGLGGMVGVSPRGELLWSLPLDMAVVAPTPVIIPPSRIFQTAGYGAGSVLLEIVQEKGVLKASKLWSRTPREGIACEQQTPILLGKNIYAVLPKDAGPKREQFVCGDLDGNILWGSGEDARFGLGPWVAGDGKFFVLEDLGSLSMAEGTPEGWKLLDKAQVLPGVDAWGPPALAGGFLLLRDSKNLICLDLRKESYIVP